MIIAQDLKDFTPTKEFFIGIDSDGCAFDSMEPKHKECFCPVFIWKYHLEAVSKYAREAWEFVNLYSKERGCNRFLALQYALDLLRDRPEVKARGVEIPLLPKLREWTTRESKLGNPTLEKLVAETNDPEMTHLLDWSHAINAAVHQIVRDVPPFPGVKDSFAAASAKADLMVVSSTPWDALDREWKATGLADFVHLIAGQEAGKKTEHLEFAAQNKYPAEKILMMGDAYGDMKAAKHVDACFYPIVPGYEEKCWERFQQEALDRFFAGTYKGAYEDALIAELDKALPEKPHWRT